MRNYNYGNLSLLRKKEHLLTKEEMVSKLKTFEKRSPMVDFRGHNRTNNEAHGSDYYK